MADEKKTEEKKFTRVRVRAAARPDFKGYYCIGRFWPSDAETDATVCATPEHEAVMSDLEKLQADSNLVVVVVPDAPATQPQAVKK